MYRAGCWPWEPDRPVLQCVPWPGWGRPMSANRWPPCGAPCRLRNGGHWHRHARLCHPGWLGPSAKKLFVAEYFISLSRDDQREVLEQVRAKTDRPTHLLEKDVWVVWALGALFDSPLAADLTFKGGTSLSKAYKIIERFSEDIDLTYDIRKLIADLTGGEGFLPASRSQAGKWTKAVRDRLPDWIATDVQPVLEAAL